MDVSELCKAGQHAHFQGQMDDAEHYYQQALALDEAEVTALHGLGLVYAQRGDYAKAEPWFLLALQHQPESALIHNHLANVYAHLRQAEKAHLHYLKAIALAPTYAPNMNNYANLLVREQNWSEATQYYKRALQLDPRYHDARENLAQAYLQLGDYASACQTLETLVQFLPQHPARRQLADLYFESGQALKAIELYEQIIAEDEQNMQHVEALHNLGAAYLRNQQKQLALAAWQSVLMQRPEHALTHANLARLYLLDGQYADALHHLAVLIKLEPHQAEHRYQQGVALLALNELHEARKCFDHAVRLQPKYADAYNNLAFIALKQGDVAAAKSFYQQALALEPDNEVVSYQLSALKQEQNKVAAPGEYIRNLYRQYAVSYEQQMTQDLHYAVPELMAQMLKMIPAHRLPLQHALELGCGTGLTGRQIKPQVMNLTGVDISAEMLALAKEKQVYETLYEREVVDFLSHDAHCYDLIIAADMVIYFGDLLPLLQAAVDRLDTHGWILFSIEKADDTVSDYQLQTNGRFVHHPSYIKALEAQLGLQRYHERSAVLRTQASQPVEGILYLLCKAGKTAP